MNIGEAMAMMLQVQEIQARDFSQKRRKQLGKSGAAMPDGSFPIVNRGDLKNAEHLAGLSKHPAAARAHIRERAKALGVKMAKSHQTHRARLQADIRNTDMGEAKSAMPL